MDGRSVGVGGEGSGSASGGGGGRGRGARGGRGACARGLVVPVGLVVLATLYRAPALRAAALTNSDAAVVGLQARHVLAGELSPMLWGSRYQTSADALWAALVFAFVGPGPRALMASSFALLLVATLALWALFARHVGAVRGGLLALPLALAPAAVHAYALYPPRQAAVTLAVLGLERADAAALALERGEARAARRAAFVAAALGSLAVAADPYALVLLPAVPVALVLVGRSRFVDRSAHLVALGWAATGAAFGAAPYAWLRLRAGAEGGVLGLDVARVGHNARLLLDPCLPWALSARPWAPRDDGAWAPVASAAVRVLGVTGGLALAAALGLGFAHALRLGTRSELARHAWVGLVGLGAAVVGFLLSVMVMDAFAVRYLASLVYFLPFVLAPWVAHAAPRRSAALLAPYLLASAAGGWLGYAPAVDGVRVPLAIPAVEEDRALERELARRGVGHVVADYWAAYRLSFAWDERLLAAPRNAVEDRHAPTRRAVEAAPRLAYVHDARRSREPREAVDDDLARAFHVLERFDVGAHRVWIVEHPSRAPLPW